MFLFNIWCVLAQVKIDPSKVIFRDAHDRHIIWHGVNVVYKVYPFIPSTDKFDPETSLADEDIQDLYDWGINEVRLGVMWEAVETAPGVYNETYLDEIEKLINKLGAKDIYTMIDVHFDTMARTTCGEGMPNFYAKKVLENPNNLYCYYSPTIDHYLGGIKKCPSMKEFALPNNEDGNPTIDACMKSDLGGSYLPTAEVTTLFRSLYQNTDGMQDLFLAYQ